MKLTLIAAMAQNRVIGRAGDLPWHLPDDLKHFKKLTRGHHVIMGRKTYESMEKPLPGRTNIVVTRSENYRAPGCMVSQSLRHAIQKAENDSQPFIIGGGDIYQQALPYADRIELTLIHTEVKGDTFFPDFSEKDWALVHQEHHPADERHAYAFDFLRYDRKQA